MTHQLSREFENPEVAEVFLSYPASVLPSLLLLRELIFETAARTEGVGELEETLRWGEPSYLTTRSKSGSMIRIGPKGGDGRYAVFFHCRTDLVSRFRAMFGERLCFEGTRAIVFNAGDKLPMEALRCCISMALTYYLAKDGPPHRPQRANPRQGRKSGEVRRGRRRGSATLEG